jgi:hypothetical protein
MAEGFWHHSGVSRREIAKPYLNIVVSAQAGTYTPPPIV